ncbi:MAG: hypothetical protein ABFS19_13990, partial [Thermodesulfobacteriota bacterium]
DFLKDRLKLVIIGCYIVIALVVVWSLTVDTSHAHTWAEKAIPGFWALFGIGSCALIIFVARLISRAGIMTREDYYDN